MAVRVASAVHHASPPHPGSAVSLATLRQRALCTTPRCCVGFFFQLILCITFEVIICAPLRVAVAISLTLALGAAAPSGYRGQARSLLSTSLRPLSVSTTPQGEVLPEGECGTVGV